MGSGSSTVAAAVPLVRRASSAESEYHTPPTSTIEPFANDPFPTEAEANGPGAVAWRKFVETGVIPDEVFADDALRHKMLAFARGEIDTAVTDEELAIAADAPWAGDDEIQNASDHLVTGKFVCGVFVPEYEQQYPVKPQHDPEPDAGVVFDEDVLDLVRDFDQIRIRGRPVPRYPLDASARVFVPGAPRHSRKRTRSEAGFEYDWN